MVNRSLVRTPTRLSLPQLGNCGYLRGTVTGSEERAQGLPGSAAVVRYRDSERGASSLHIIRQIPAQAHWHPGWQRGGIKPSPGSGPGRGLAASGTVGDGARAGAFVLEPRLAPSRRCSVRPAGLRAGSPARGHHWHWRSTLKVPSQPQWARAQKSGGDPHHPPETGMQPSCALRVTCMYQIEVVIGVGLRLALKYY